MATSMSETSPQRHRYGPDPSQFADLHLPAGRRRPGTVVLIHGGWWGPRFGAGNLDGVAADLAGRGWVAWNLEYRRLGLGGGYPSTLADAAAAIDHLATLADVDTERVAAVGHSAGGHLATWAAGRNKLAAGAPGAQPVIEIAGVNSRSSWARHSRCKRHRAAIGHRRPAHDELDRLATVRGYPAVLQAGPAVAPAK